MYYLEAFPSRSDGMNAYSVPSVFDILPRLKSRESHGTAPLGWDIVVYDVTCS